MPPILNSIYYYYYLLLIYHLMDISYSLVHNMYSTHLIHHNLCILIHISRLTPFYYMLTHMLLHVVSIYIYPMYYLAILLESVPIHLLYLYNIPMSNYLYICLYSTLTSHCTSHLIMDLFLYSHIHHVFP